MTEYDFFGYLVLSIYFGFVIILGIIVFLIVNMQRIKKEMTKLKKDMSISIEKETVESKMDIFMVIENESVKLTKNMSSEFEDKLVKLKREMSTELNNKLVRLKRDMSLGSEKELVKLNKNMSEGIAALVSTVKSVAPEKIRILHEKSREKLTRRG